MQIKKLTNSIKVVLLVSTVMGAGYSTTVFAEDGHDFTNEEAVGGEARLMHLAGEHNLTFGAGITMVGQNLSGDTAAAGDQTGITYSADIVFEGDFGDKGEALIYLNTAQGTSVDPMAGVGGVNGDDEAGPSSAGGYSDTRIAEAWYKMPLAEKVSMTVGKIDPTGIYDGNNVANDETAQFLGDVFVNNAAIEFPGYAAGLSFEIQMNDQVTINLGTFEPTDDFAGDQADTFTIAELGFTTNALGGKSNIRLTSWENSDTDNKGFAVNADHAINDDIIVFGRYGTQEDTQDFDSALSIGGQYALGDDVIGAAYSLATATATGGDDESQFEIYYSYALADHVHVTADFQQISNPGFDSNTDSVNVVGLRIQTDL